ncbi:glycoside hydrolase family 3 protein [Clostridium sp. AF19-22AC]|jgi:beta-glucosidase-like glycosyl hydrolase|uniref:glycoside hydrolase family 3 protein n=1 Tax=Clostridia TaxID=186801 RepID=UPI000E4FE404|nr:MULTISPECIES: glycoside hydrolase family 3 N-terminal domain-containing protein [Clostridia]RHR26284.1 glycoside hydrolase family 3 protein [Clostridium sp. AF19-22AC]
MINLQEKPFYLEQEAIDWVNETLENMTIEEKIGQLFIHLGRSTDEGYLKNMVEKFHIGGARYIETDSEKIFRQNQIYQKFSKIPMFVAVNGETGGNGLCKDGTFVATEAECEAAGDTEAAYMMGKVSGSEAQALGCNWNFAPMADIVFNWRNTIVNTRSFGKDPDTVLDMCRAYLKGSQESNVLSCVKHFPGDGVEERDQHLVMGINSLSCEEWDDSFGKVYKGLIEDGLESVMAGHIALPSYSKKYCPQKKDKDIMPATLAPELIEGLLRTELGFQGIVVTDASHMGGLLSAKPRSEQVPGAIAAGCDMFLFFHDPEEDFQYMLDGYTNGIITKERLNEAVTRILGMKAKLNLHKKRMPEIFDEQHVLGCEQHYKYAEVIADKAITLVKDTADLLPVDVNEKKRARLYFLESAPVSYLDGPDPAKKIVTEELEKAGFEVDVNESYYELEMKEMSRFNRYKVMDMPGAEEFKSKYDIVFVFINMKGYAQENNVRLKYSAAHSNELPWWVREIPTVCVSLNYTNHLYDLPMMKTFINAYAPTRACIRAAVEKIVGNSEFKGKYNKNVWCGCWDTRL